MSETEQQDSQPTELQRIEQAVEARLVEFKDFIVKRFDALRGHLGGEIDPGMDVAGVINDAQSDIISKHEELTGAKAYSDQDPAPGSADAVQPGMPAGESEAEGEAQQS